MAEIVNVKAIYAFCCNYAKFKVLEVLSSTVREITYDLQRCSHSEMIMTQGDKGKS